MSDLACANCAYEVDEVTSRGFCDTCQRAYDLGTEWREMAKCKESGCDNEVDTFYYCDDHFRAEEGEGEECDECGEIHDEDNITIREDE